MKKIEERIKLFELPIFSGDIISLLTKIQSQVSSDGILTYIFTPNPEQVVLSLENPEFYRTLCKADYLIPDGIGLVWASRLQAKLSQQPGLTSRITGVELAEALLDLAREQQLRVMLIGGQGYADLKNESLGEIVLKGLKITWTPGYADVTQPTPTEEARVIEAIKKTSPELLFVAFGAPYQEFWLTQHRALLEEMGVRVGMVVGGSFDFILGKVVRAPLIWQRFGLEWLFRLYQEPWRWRRQLRLVRFVGYMAWEILKQKTSPR